MKKMLAILLVLIMSLAMLPAMAADNDTIVWGDWMLSEDAYAPIYQAMVDTYTAANPETKVETYYQPYSSYLDQLLVAAANRNAPDVVHIKAEWLPQFLELGVVKDVYPYVSEEILADYNPAALSTVQVDGKLLGLPWFNNGYAILYNKDLLEKAGITELPKTLDELFAAAEKISALGTDENGSKIYGIGLAASNNLEAGDGYNTLPVLWGYGGDFQDAEGKISLTDEAAIKAYSQIQKMYVNGISPVGASFKDIRNLFGQGLIGFYWDASAGAGAAASASGDEEAFYARTGAMVIPNAEGPAGHGYTSDRFMIVFDSVPDEKMPLVVDFMGHMSGAECINILYENKQGKMSSRGSVMDEVYANVESEIDAAFVEAMKSARPLPCGNIKFMDSDEMLQNALTRLAQGEDVATVMADCQAQIQALYDGE